MSDWVEVRSKNFKAGGRKLTATPAKLAALLKSVIVLSPPMSGPHMEMAQAFSAGKSQQGTFGVDKGPLVRKLDFPTKLAVDGVVCLTNPRVADNGPFFSPRDRSRPTVMVNKDLTFSGAAKQAPPIKNFNLDSPTKGCNGFLCLAEQRKKRWSVQDIRSRLSRIYASMKNKCYRCTERGHMADTCPNAKVCFYCKSTGHLLRSCPKLFPSSSPSTNPNPTLAISAPSPSAMATPIVGNGAEIPHVVPVYEDDAIRALEAKIERSVVIKVNGNMTYSMVMAGVQHYFINTPGSSFTVRMLKDHHYQIEGSVAWKKEVSSQGFLRVGLLDFPILIEREAHKLLDPRVIPQRIWVRMVGVPYGWFQLHALQKLLLFGEIVALDKATVDRVDLRWARVEVQVKNRSSIPMGQEFAIMRADGSKTMASISYVVEEDDPGTVLAREILAQDIFSFSIRDFSEAVGHLSRMAQEKEKGKEIMPEGEGTDKTPTATFPTQPSYKSAPINAGNKKGGIKIFGSSSSLAPKKKINHKTAAQRKRNVWHRLDKNKGGANQAKNKNSGVGNHSNAEAISPNLETVMAENVRLKEALAKQAALAKEFGNSITAGESTTIEQVRAEESKGENISVMVGDKALVTVSEVETTAQVVSLTPEEVLDVAPLTTAGLPRPKYCHGMPSKEEKRAVATGTKTGLEHQVQQACAAQNTLAEDEDLLD